MWVLEDPFLFLLLDDSVVLISSFLNNGLFLHFPSTPPVHSLQERALEEG